METHEDDTSFQVGDHVRIKITRETGTIKAADGGVVSVILDGTNESKFFSAFDDEDAFIELVTVKDEASILQRESMRSQGA